MANKKKINFFTKTNKIGNLSVTILFIFTFLLIVFNKTDYFVVNKLKSLSIDIVNPVTKIIAMPMSITSNTYKIINNYRYLSSENQKLKEEIIRLRKWQTFAIKNYRENKAYKKLLNSTSNNLNIVKTAIVTNQSPGIYSKSVIINAGSDSGTLEDQAVINERGLIGKILTVTNKNSKVLLINDQNSSVPVKSMSGDLYAIVKGTLNGKYLTSSFIKGNKKPKVGDVLVTSGSAKTFPQDLLVGKIVKVDQNNFIALPYVDFDNLSFVQVIDLH